MNVRDHFWAGLERLGQSRLGKGIGTTPGSAGREARQAASLASRHEIVIDGGAHHGDWSAGLLERASPRRLILVDADPTNDAGLKARFSGREGVTVVSSALSSEDGTAPLYSVNAGSEVASLYDRGATSVGTFAPIAEVSTMSLKTLMERESLERVDILKLDIEGHELAVLIAARADGTLDRIDVIQFEFGLCNLDIRTMMRDFWEILSPAFTFYRIGPRHPILIPHYRPRDETFLTTNYVCKRRL